MQSEECIYLERNGTMTKTMKWLAGTLWIVGFSMFGYAAHAEQYSAHWVNGNKLLEICNSNNQNACGLYILGTAEGLVTNGAMCIPLGVTGEQLKDIVVRDLVRNPE